MKIGTFKIDLISIVVYCRVVFLQIMIKSVLGATAALLTLGGAGMAGEVYMNPEVNTSMGTESGWSAIVEGHIGYDFDNGAYLQAGPAVVIPKSGQSGVELSGKAGIGSGPYYGEVSFITGDEMTIGIKAGAKLKNLF